MTGTSSEVSMSGASGAGSKLTIGSVSRGPWPTQFLSGDTPWAGFPALTGCLYVHPSSVALVHEQVRASVRFEWGVEEREWGRER
jgi:hypothetical protein